MDEDDNVPIRTPRRSTLPILLYPDNIQLNFNPMDSEESEEESLSLKALGIHDGFVRSGSLKHVPASTRPQGGAKMSSVVNARKKSLPDITNIGQEKKVMTRETVAVLSSQRREAIRKQEEEAEKLRTNLFLYLMRPELKNWLSEHQFLLLVLFINFSFALMLFKLVT